MLSWIFKWNAWHRISPETQLSRRKARAFSMLIADVPKTVVKWTFIAIALIIALSITLIIVPAFVLSWCTSNTARAMRATSGRHSGRSTASPMLLLSRTSRRRPAPSLDREQTHGRHDSAASSTHPSTPPPGMHTDPSGTQGAPRTQSQVRGLDVDVEGRWERCDAAAELPPPYEARSDLPGFYHATPGPGEAAQIGPLTRQGGPPVQSQAASQGRAPSDIPEGAPADPPAAIPLDMTPELDAFLQSSLESTPAPGSTSNHTF